MYIADEYLRNLFVSNPTKLNSNTGSTGDVSSEPLTINNNNNKITLMQQTYLIMLTIVALKVLNSSMYGK